MSTLVYSTGALGDVLCTYPLLTVWKERFPDEKIIMLGNRATGEFSAAWGMCDEWWDISRWVFCGLFNSDKPPSPALRSEFTNSDIVHAIVLAADNSPVITVLHMLGIRNILHHPPFPVQRINAAEYHLQLLTNHATEWRAIRPNISFLNGMTVSLNTAEEREITGSCVLIHPGSGSPLKNWPFERFIALANRLRQCGYPVVWCAGRAEEDFRFPAGETILRDKSLWVLAQLILSAGLFIGNDSGVAHLAAALKIPTVAIFGPSDPVVWGPRGDHVRIIEHEYLCGPCHRSPDRQSCAERPCLFSISVEEVLETAVSLYTQYGKRDV